MTFQNKIQSWEMIWKHIPPITSEKNRLLSSKKSQEMIVMGCVATLKIRMHLWTFDIMWPVESSYSTNVIKSHIFQKHKLEINAQKNVYRSQFLAQWTPLWTLNNPTTIKKNTHHYMYLKYTWHCVWMLFWRIFFLTWNSTKQNQRIIMVYFLKLFYFLHAENSALTDLQYQKMSSREQSWINATTL